MTKLLAALETVGRSYIGDGEWGTKVRRVAYDLLELWKRDNVVGDALMEWLKVAMDEQAGHIVSDVVPRLERLGQDTLEMLGKAIRVVGTERSGLFFETYFRASDKYEKNVVDLFLRCIEKHPEQLGAWSEAIEGNAKIFHTTAPRSDRVSIEEYDIEGIWKVMIIDVESKENVFLDLRPIERGQKVIQLPEDTINAGASCLLILKPAEVRDFILMFPTEFIKSDGQNVYLITKDGSAIPTQAVLKGHVGDVYLETKVIDSEGEEHVFRFTKIGTTYLCFDPYKRSPVKDLELKVVKDGSGQIVVRLLMVHYDIASRMVISLSRKIPSDPIYFLSNDANLIEIESGQSYFRINKVVQSILGVIDYREISSALKGGDAIIGLIFGKGGAVDARWSTDIEDSFRIDNPDEILGVLVIKKDGLRAKSLDGSINLELRDKALRVEGVKGLEKIEIEEAHFKQVPTLEITLKSGTKICFEMSLSEDGKSIVSDLAYEHGRHTPKIVSIQFRPFDEISFSEDGEVYKISLENFLIIEYVETGLIHKTAVGLYEPLPKGILQESEHFVAKLYGRDLMKSQGWVIEGEEYQASEEIRFDFVLKQQEERAVLECKHGNEIGGDLIRQADRYFDYVKQKGWRLVYYFLHEPQTIYAKELFNHLINLKRQNPGDVVIYLGSKEYKG